jgi:hypothetical protein
MKEPATLSLKIVIQGKMAGILYRSLAIAYTGQVGCRADLILEAAKHPSNVTTEIRQM